MVCRVIKREEKNLTIVGLTYTLLGKSTEYINKIAQEQEVTTRKPIRPPRKKKRNPWHFLHLLGGRQHIFPAHGWQEEVLSEIAEREMAPFGAADQSLGRRRALRTTWLTRSTVFFILNFFNRLAR